MEIEDNASNMWMVRAGEGGRLFDDFKDNSVVAISWKSVGDLSKVQSKNEVRQIVDRVYHDEKLGSRIVTSSQIARFRFDFKEGDNVITYDPESRIYQVGKIRGQYQYDPARKEYFHVRKVEWIGTVPRDKLSAPTRNTLGAATTTFDTGREAETEILSILQMGKPIGLTTQEEDQQQLEEVVKDQENRAKELIKDKVSNLDWEDAQRLVAAILQAMGYKTRISPMGPDRGKDIVASPDGLGLNEPRIIVEVKHRSGRIGPRDVKSFITGLRAGQKGLYVSTGGFTREAELEAERSDVPLTLIDLEQMVELIIRYYDSFDADNRLLLPLTKTYWPK
jgi:restriction system protein